MKDRSRSALASAVLSSSSVEIASCRCPLSTSTLAAAGIDCGLGALHAGDRLIAVGLRLLQRLSARRVARHQLVLPVEFQFGARGGCLRGNKLRPGLLDGGLLRRDLMRHPRDRRFLGRDLLARRIDRQPIIAVVDGGDHVAGMDVGVVGDRNAGEIAGHLGGERRVVGLHIGVVGRDHEAADRQIIIAEPASDRRPHDDGATKAMPILRAARPLLRLPRQPASPGTSVETRAMGDGPARLRRSGCRAGAVDWLRRLRFGHPQRRPGGVAAVLVLVAIHAPHSSGAPSKARDDRTVRSLIGRGRAKVNIDRTVRSIYMWAVGFGNWRRVSGFKNRRIREKA